MAPEVRGWGLVVGREGEPPGLCLGAVPATYPPRPGGLKLRGWDWDAVSGWTQDRGMNWGSYVVTGRWDGRVLTLTRPPVPSEEYDGPLPLAERPDDWLRTPCPEPDGGWRPVDPERTSEQTLDDVVRTAHELPGFAGVFIDQSINPDLPDERAANDPARLVLNVRVTGDPAVAERRLREVWGGALCVSRGLRTEAEVRRIHDELPDVDGFLGSSADFDQVTLDVVYDDGSLQRWYDELYGVGAVEVRSALVPLASLG
jgi:hypothetical protein